MLRPLPPSPDHVDTLNHRRYLSNLWDRALSVPGTRFRVGFESLLGLLPIGGDVTLCDDHAPAKFAIVRTMALNRFRYHGFDAMTRG